MNDPTTLDPNGGLPALSEQDLNTIFGPTSVAQKRKDLEKKQQMIDALRNPQMAQGHRSALGAGLAGVGDMLNAWRGRKMSKRQDADMAGLPAEEQAARAKAYQMIQALRQPEQLPPPQPVEGPQMIR